MLIYEGNLHKIGAISQLGAEKITFPPIPDGQIDIRTEISIYRVASLLKKKSTLFLTSLVMITWCQIKFYVEIVQFTNHLITSRFISSSLLQDFSLSEILETFQEIKMKNKTNVKIFVWRCEEGGGWDFPPNLPHVQGPDLSNKGNCSFF